MTKDKNFSVINYDDLQSKTMDWLRFPLMIAVCFIHIPHNSFINIHPSIIVHSVYFFISQVLARIAVPLFFIISGYYFFYNKNEKECIFNKDIYISKLKKRIKTLLIPYLFWNFLSIVILLFRTHTLLSPLTILSYFLYGGGQYRPLAFQFWFIRDLMLICLISPLLYYILKKGKFISILLLFILWMLPIKYPPFPMVCIFFFSIGAFFSINSKNIIKEIANLPKYPLYIITIIMMLIDLIINESPATTVHGANNNTYIHNIFILLGIITTLSLISEYFKEGKLKRVNKQLSNASFFLFAVHPQPLYYIFLLLLKILPHNDFTFLSVYLLSVPLVCISAVLIYNLLKKYFPKITAIITGGR